MFCSYCGREISNDSVVCGYCGASIQSNAPIGDGVDNSQEYNSQINNNPQYYNGQPNNYNQQYYGGQPSYGVSPTYNNMPEANNQQYYNNRDIKLKPDNKFNLAAGLFSWIWALFKGLWDMALLVIICDSVFGLLIFIPMVGWFFWLVYLLTRLFSVGRNANYYYRLKETQRIPFRKAIKDPNLRRI